MMVYPESTEELGPGVIQFYRVLFFSHLHCCEPQFSQNGMLRTRLRSCFCAASGSEAQGLAPVVVMLQVVRFKTRARWQGLPNHSATHVLSAA